MITIKNRPKLTIACQLIETYQKANRTKKGVILDPLMKV